MSQEGMDTLTEAPSSWKRPVLALLTAVALAGCESSPPPPSPPTSQSIPNDCPQPEVLPAPWSPSSKIGVTVGEGVKKVDFSSFLVRPENTKDLEQRLNQLAAAHVSEVRFDTAWNRLEPTRCGYDWRMLDPWMQGLAARRITALMIVGKVPRWATDVPNCNAAEGKCAPRNPADYGAFAAALATRYAQFKPNIELGNEIKNIPPAIYAEMCGSAYTRIKQASPNSLVLFGSKAPTDARAADDPDRPATFFTAVDRTKNKDGTAKCSWDVMSAHPYTDPLNGRVRAGDNDQANGWGQMLELRRATESAGHGSKPFWITEFGSAVVDDQIPQLITALDQLKKYPWATRLFWFTLRTDPAAAEDFGAIDASGRERPVFKEIQRINAP